MVFDIISYDRLTNHGTHLLQESVTATTMSSTSVLLWSQQLRVSHLVFVIGNMCSSPKDEHQIGLVCKQSIFLEILGMLYTTWFLSNSLSSDPPKKHKSLHVIMLPHLLKLASQCSWTAQEGKTGQNHIFQDILWLQYTSCCKETVD